MPEAYPTSETYIVTQNVPSLELIKIERRINEILKERPGSYTAISHGAISTVITLHIASPK